MTILFVVFIFVHLLKFEYDINSRGNRNILNQNPNAVSFYFDDIFVQAHALSPLFHLIKQLFSRVSNRTLVLTIRIKLAKIQCIVLRKDNWKTMHDNVPVFDN